MELLVNLLFNLLVNSITAIVKIYFVQQKILSKNAIVKIADVLEIEDIREIIDFKEKKE